MTEKAKRYSLIIANEIKNYDEMSDLQVQLISNNLKQRMSSSDPVDSAIARFATAFMVLANSKAITITRAEEE